MNPFVSGSIFFRSKIRFSAEAEACEAAAPKEQIAPSLMEPMSFKSVPWWPRWPKWGDRNGVTEMGTTNGNKEWYEYVWICMTWRWTMKFDSVGCPKNQEWASILWPFCHRTKINDDDKMEVFLGPLFSDNHNPTFSRFLNTNFPKQRTYLTYRTNLSWNLSCLLLGFEPSIVPF